MDIKTFSQILREHREEAGISVLDLADHLRLSKDVILELERGEYLPASLDVFRRSYLRQYAQKVGLPLVDVDHFFLTLGVVGVNQRVPKQKFHYDHPHQHRRVLRWTTLSFIVLMLVLVLIWAFWQHADPTPVEVITHG